MNAAPVKQITKDKFLCIEYPGYIKNVDKALETMGGIDNIIKVFYFKLCFIDYLNINLRSKDQIQIFYL